MVLKTNPDGAGIVQALGPLKTLAAERANIDVRLAWGAGHGFLLWRPWAIRRTVTWALRAAAGG